MRLVRSAALVAAVFGLGGCVGAEAVSEMNYLATEYGNVKEDAVVSGVHGDHYRVWVHSTKPKMIVGMMAADAFSAGAIYSGSLGVAKPGVELGTYNLAAEAYFRQIGRTDCRATNARPILNTGVEFDYSCERAERPAPSKAPS